jgi:uncharacterized protein YjbI with pentapeptide repeats
MQRIKLFIIPILYKILSQKEYECCTFINCDFSNSDLAEIIFVECVFEGCIDPEINRIKKAKFSLGEYFKKNKEKEI